MKIVPKEPKSNRARVLVQSLDDHGKPVGGRAGYAKNKQITLYETTVEEVYQICLDALKQKAEEGGN